MTERCNNCTGGNIVMCDAAFTGSADQLNMMSDHLEARGVDESTLDFSAVIHSSGFVGLKHVLQGPISLDCGLNDEQIFARLQETRKFRKDFEDITDREI